MLTAEKFYLFSEWKCGISEHIVSKLNIQRKFHGNFKELAAFNIYLNIDKGKDVLGWGFFGKDYPLNVCAGISEK